MIKPIVNDLTSGVTTSMVFCVDEGSQSRRNLAGMISGEGEYELEWCVKAVQEEKGDLDRAREWLKNRAPKIGELVS